MVCRHEALNPLKFEELAYSTGMT